MPDEMVDLGLVGLQQMAVLWGVQGPDTDGGIEGAACEAPAVCGECAAEHVGLVGVLALRGLLPRFVSVHEIDLN